MADLRKQLLVGKHHPARPGPRDGRPDLPRPYDAQRLAAHVDPEVLAVGLCLPLAISNPVGQLHQATLSRHDQRKGRPDQPMGTRQGSQKTGTVRLVHILEVLDLGDGTSGPGHASPMTQLPKSLHTESHLLQGGNERRGTLIIQFDQRWTHTTPIECSGKVRGGSLHGGD